MKNITATEEAAIQAPPDKVWEALTDPELIKQYFFGTYATSKWKEGSEITFEGEWEGKEYKDKGTILRLIPGKLLSYNFWSSMSGLEDKPEDRMIITYDLSGEGDACHLTIRQQNIPTEEMREHSEENWRKVLDGLKQLVEK